MADDAVYRVERVHDDEITDTLTQGSLDWCRGFVEAHRLIERAVWCLDIVCVSTGEVYMEPTPPVDRRRQEDRDAERWVRWFDRTTSGKKE
jgi:hypothetical protein